MLTSTLWGMIHCSHFIDKKTEAYISAKVTQFIRGRVWNYISLPFQTFHFPVR